PLLQHQMEETAEALRITGHDILEGLDGVGTAEVKAEHGTDLSGDEGHAGRIGAVLHALQQAAGVFAQLIVESGAADQPERGQAGGHRQRITGQGAGLVDRAQRRNLFHDLALATEGTHRHAAADDLAEGGQVRGDTEMRLGTAQGDAKAGHHLIEDQHHAILVADLAQTFEEPRHRRNTVHVAGHRLDDDAGDILAHRAQGFTYRSDVVVGQGQGVLGKGRRHARGAGYTEGQCAGADLDQQAVGMTVLSAFELDDGITAGIAAGQTDGAHRCLGTGTDRAHHVHGEPKRAHQLGHFGFHGGGCTVGQAVLELAADRVQHLRVPMAENHRTPGADVVHIAPVVLVDDVGTLSMFDEQRTAADAAEGAYRRVDATGDVFLGTGKKIFGAGHGYLSFVNKVWKARARRCTSAADSAPNRPWTTASRSAPAFSSGGARSTVIPPMATMGRLKRWRARVSNSEVAAGAPGLVSDWKKRPKAI